MNEQDFARLALSKMQVIEPTADEQAEMLRREAYELLQSFRLDMKSYVTTWERFQIPTFERSVNDPNGSAGNRNFAQRQLDFYYNDVAGYRLTDTLTPDNALEILQQVCDLVDIAEAKGLHSLLDSFLLAAARRIANKVSQPPQKPSHTREE